MVYEHKSKNGKEYFLHTVKSKYGADLYYFSGTLNKERAIDLPAGFKVIENPKTGLPMLKRK
jgi:YHS domain-containing protein